MTGTKKYPPIHRLLQAVATVTILLTGAHSAAAPMINCIEYDGMVRVVEYSSSIWMLTSHSYSDATAEIRGNPAKIEGWFSGSLPPGLTIEMQEMPYTGGALQVMKGRITAPGLYRLTDNERAEWWHSPGPRAPWCLFDVEERR